ncbi:hypothetical protein LJC27_05505, partial [Christensenellaceae bacterium OttesenSCG-928-M15]|nr:hypothetical protein [Christensenellaceae bacterium OttesenSCG-928-M15]
DGTATIYYIHAGTYTVRETANVGLGYTDAKDVSVTVSRKNGISNPATVRFANDPTTLEFTKLDELTKEVLDGATFQLMDSSGTVVALKQVEADSYRPDSTGGSTFTTKNGKAVIRYLVPGQYTITESTAPTGYAKDTDKSININKYNDTSNPAKVTMQDKPLALEFTKTDEMTGVLLDGCTFTLKDNSGNTIKLRRISDGVYTPDSAGVSTFTTKDGMAIIGPISPGTYTVTEAVAAPGYAKGEDVTITVTDQNVTTNPAKGSMANVPLAVTIYKIDSETKQPFGGTVFRLLDADGAAIKISPIPEKAGWYQYDRAGEETFTMPTSGSLTISGLPEGAYQLEETQENAGYKRLTELVAITVDEEHTYKNPSEFTVENEPLILQVAKTDGFNGEPLPNVSFSILDEDGNELKFVKISEGEYRVSKDSGLTLFETGADGIATIKLIPEGSYVLHETENPGFGKVDPVPFTVMQDSAGETPTVVGVENFPLCMELAKVDKIDKSPLANVPFKLVDSSGNALLFAKQEEGAHHVDPNGSEIFKTDMNGKALLRYVPAGTYTLVEQEYDGYGTHAPVEITITVENKPENPFKIKLENIPLAMELIKTDSYTGKPMEAAFKLLDMDGKEITLALMSDGTYRPLEVTLRQQEQQKALAEKEAQEDDPDSVPDEGDSAAGETEKEPDNPKPDNTEDEQKPDAPDKEPDAEPYEPATFKEKADFLKTDAKGFARIEYLSPGKYTLKEEPIPGYVPLNGVGFEVTNAHTFTQPLECAVKNIPTRLLIEKQDGYSGSPLVGATFKLTNSSGQDIKLFKEKDGNLRPALEGETGAEVFALNDAAQIVILYLEAGVYTLTEVEGPVGYGIAAPMQVEVGTEAALELALAARGEDNDSPFIAESSVAVVDMPLALKISKVHAKSGKPLQGAAFALKAQGNLSTPLRFTLKDGAYWFDEKGNVTQIDMDKNAEALVLGLPVGKYVLEETVVPEHFFPAVPQNVEIAAAHTSASPQTVVVQNTPTVKLGIDSDKFNTVIGIGVLLLAMLIFCCSYFLRLRKQA